MDKILDGVQTGDWLIVNFPLGRVEQAFLVQVTEITKYDKVVAGQYKFNRDGRQFPIKTPRLIARPAKESEVQSRKR